MNKLKDAIVVYHSSLSNNIYAGKPSKNKPIVLWKKDVTLEALIAVAKHVEQFGEAVIIMGGGEKITISVNIEREVSDEGHK